MFLDKVIAMVSSIFEGAWELVRFCLYVALATALFTILVVIALGFIALFTGSL